MLFSVRWTPALIQDTMNLWYEKGYKLSQFAVETEPLHLYVAVMEHPDTELKRDTL